MKPSYRAMMFFESVAILGALLAMPSSTARAESAHSGDAETQAASVASPKDDAVSKFVNGCRKKAVKEANCDKLRKEAIEILKEDLHTLGSSASRRYVKTILRIFRSDEPELRIAAADALGMIGPQDGDAEFLAPLANDPVPDVRQAVSQMISRGKGATLSLLAQRTMTMRTGLTPETPPDAGKFAMPVAPESTYLFYASDATSGRLSYIAKGGDPAAFFKGKAKKEPMKLEDFKETYRYQLKDQDHALDQAQDAAAKQLENQKPPDPTNTQAMMEYLEKAQSVSVKRMTMAHFDTFQANLFGAPTVYILEERQIGKRTYPTRYVVLYQDLAFKRPGYRLSWITVSDDLLKTAQATSLAEEKEELANKAESEAIKKKQAELDSLTKKKDAAEKKQFKKGQEDLEKALGF
jgi:hypothetical protein